MDKLSPLLNLAEIRAIISIGRHQDEQNPKSMSELAEDFGVTLRHLQRGHEEVINYGYVYRLREGTSTHLFLTPEGEEMYQALENYIELTPD
jgi:DNA-binding MarR family transcriptional regulator